LERALKILFVTSELAPLVSTGGLADVACALSKALKAQGHDVRLAMPCYRSLTEKQRGDQYCLCVADMGGKVAHGAMRLSSLTDTRIPLYLIEHEGYFGREKPYGVGAYEYDDNAERFSFFCQALLHGISQTGWKPDVIHCNDWHTAPIPALIKARFAGDPFWGGMPTLFTIHNMAYQGRYPTSKYAATGLPPELLTPGCMEYEGDMNLMKGAIAFASKLNTVSPRYAKEIQTLEYGAGLDGMLRTRAGDLSGILNGVDYDLWSPRTDPHLPVNYHPGNLSGKDRCKAAFQSTLGLPEQKAPLIGVVGRLFWQKGIDLLLDALPQIMDLDLQLVVLGTGDPDLETRIRAAAELYPDKLGAVLRFDIPLAHEIQAASDFMLMPSRYEPCGLNQLYAMAYGAIPIVRRTGGLADSVADVNPVNLRHGLATGISFVPLTPAAVTRSIRRALEMYRQPEVLGQVRAAGMAADFSWDRSCRAYVQLYQEAMLRP
jgi:starch synthase